MKRSIRGTGPADCSAGPVSAFALAAGLLLAGCAGTPMTDTLVDTPPAGLPQAVELADTPFFPQTEYYCGPAALATTLEASGLPATPDAVAVQVFTPGRKGSLQADVVTAARRHGRLPVPVDGMPDAFWQVAEGRPVLILQNLSLEMAPQWHYAVLVGYDLASGDAILRSGTERRLVMPLETLEHTWRRTGFWGIVLAAPDGPVPATASPADWLAQAAGLERVGRRTDAIRAYYTAMEHWPDEVAPRIALGNALYDAGNLGGAEAALRGAVDAAPEHPIALNNLAHVLLERGRLEEAERLAMRAVAQGGVHIGTAARTLAEVRARRAG